MPRILFIALLFAASVLSAQDAQPTQDNRSLAERAAAAHKNKPADSGSAATAPLGQTADCGYHNESIGLDIKCPAGWKPLTEGQMNVTRAISHEISNGQVSPELSQRLIKFLIHDSSGQSVVLTIDPLHITQTPDQLKSEFMKGTKAVMPNVQFGEEKTTLSDAAHSFVAMRGVLPLQGLTLFQSYQLFQLKGSLLSIVITTSDQDELSNLVNKVRTLMTWTAPAATPTP